MLSIRYNKSQGNILILFDNVEQYGDLSRRNWQVRTTLKYALLHEGFVICECGDLTGLFVQCSDGTRRLVELAEKHLDAPGIAFGTNPYPWQVRVKCQGIDESFPVCQAKLEKEVVPNLFLEKLASELNKANLLLQ